MASKPSTRQDRLDRGALLAAAAAAAAGSAAVYAAAVVQSTQIRAEAVLTGAEGSASPALTAARDSAMGYASDLEFKANVAASITGVIIVLLVIVAAEPVTRHIGPQATSIAAAVILLGVVVAFAFLVGLLAEFAIFGLVLWAVGATVAVVVLSRLLALKGDRKRPAG